MGNAARSSPLHKIPQLSRDKSKRGYIPWRNSCGVHGRAARTSLRRTMGRQDRLPQLQQLVMPGLRQRTTPS